MNRRVAAILAAGIGISTWGYAEEAAALAPWQGEQRAVVVLLEWANEPQVVSRAIIEETFFDTTESSMSLRSYFLENARGKFDITGDVLDWRQTATRWNSGGGCNLRPIVDAAWRAFSDLNVADYDADGNGKVDNFFIVHSGRIARDRVGPECTFTSDRRADHTIVFQSQGLGSVGDAVPIGFYIHEGGHGYYNLPDLYGDHYRGRYGVGMWGMMGLGAWGVRNDIPTEQMFRVPAHFEPLSKVRVGWVEPRIIRQTTRGVVINPVELTNDIVAVPAGRGVNYYLEYRSPRGFSAGHKGHGLLVWRNYTLVQADGRDDLNRGNNLGRRPIPPISENFGDATDPFPGAGGVTSYEDRSAGIRFENIAITDDTVTLDVVLRQEHDYIEPTIPEFEGIERL